MKTLIFPFVLFLSVMSCNDETVQPVDWNTQRKRCDPQDRVGCICKDGTRLTSIEITACDNNGGFERWICKWD